MSYHWTKGHRSRRRRDAVRPDRALDEIVGAEDGVRTRDLNLGKVALYQLSHFRSCTAGPPVWCREPESNWRHRDFQSRALPTELSRPDGLTRLVARRRAENTTAHRWGGEARPPDRAWPGGLAGRTQRAGRIRTQRRLAGQLAQAVDPVDERRVGREERARVRVELHQRVVEVEVLGGRVGFLHH